MADFSLERQLALSQQYKLIAGIDEAGRGPLAGPVVAAAVILDYNSTIFDKVNDSKQLGEKNREKLFDVICNNSISYSIQLIDNIRIDSINILNATMLAMSNAVDSLKYKPDYLLIDGNYYNNNKIPYRTVIKGDSISTSIAASSILAKVFRDRWVAEIAHKEYPEYNFAKHKGYATNEHIELIKKHGACKYHRRTFLTKILGSPNTLFD